MPWFTGSDRRTITIQAPIDRVIAFMSNPAKFKDSIGQLDRAERIDDQTYRFVHRSISEKGVKFCGDRTVTFEYDGSNTLSWRTVSNGNMNTHGEAVFAKHGDNATCVEFSETIECEMQCNRILARIIKPLVERHIANGVSGYLDSIRTRIEAAG